MRLLHVSLGIMGAMLAASVALAQADDKDAAARLSLARQAVALSSPEKALEALGEQVAANPAVKQLVDSINIDTIRDQSALLMAKHFSSKELKAMIDFYGTAEGKAIMAKMPAYQKDLSVVIQKEVMQALQQRMQAPQGGGMGGGMGTPAGGPRAVPTIPARP